MDCSLPGSSVHGILQARILEWVAIPFSREFLLLPDPGLEPRSPALQADSIIQATREAPPWQARRKSNIPLYLQTESEDHAPKKGIQCPRQATGGVKGPSLPASLPFPHLDCAQSLEIWGWGAGGTPRPSLVQGNKLYPEGVLILIDWAIMRTVCWVWHRQEMQSKPAGKTASLCDHIRGRGCSNEHPSGPAGMLVIC